MEYITTKVGGQTLDTGVLDAPGLSTAHIWPQDTDAGLKTWFQREYFRTGGLARPSGPARVLYAKGGNVAALRMGVRYELQGGGRRGAIYGFSYASRLRLYDKVNSINRDLVDRRRCWFVTLTYPGKAHLVPMDWRVWKRHLVMFRKRLQRTWGKFPTFWKLEFQKRGAAHFHLLAVVPEDMARSIKAMRLWVSRAWNEIAGQSDQDHYKAGTKVERVKCWKNVLQYTGKYIGKTQGALVDKETGEIQPIGRVWGLWNGAPDNLQASVVMETITFEQAVKVRRVMRRYAQRHSVSRLVGFKAYVPSEVTVRMVEWSRAGINPAKDGGHRCEIPGTIHRALDVVRQLDGPRNC